MLEYKNMKVATYQENRLIQALSCFGWQLVSNQEINTKNSYLEKRGDSIYQVHESENYVKLTFARDTNIPNRNQLIDLEAVYHKNYHIAESYYAKMRSVEDRCSYKKIIILAVLGIVLPTAMPSAWGIKLALIGIAGLLFALRKIFVSKYKAQDDKYTEIYRKATNTARELLR